MDENIMMPNRYWLYLWAILAIIIMVPCLTEGVIFSLYMGVVMSGILTVWIFAVYIMWYADSIFYKIVAVVLGGIFAVIAAFLVQSAYEKIILKKEDAELQQIGDAS